MELRPELTPPALDEALVARLARLAERRDGAAEGRCDDEPAEFNRLAGTALPLGEFQGIYTAADPEEFVRDVLYRRSLKLVPDLSREEMAEIVSRAQAGGVDQDFCCVLFEHHCKHPAESDLIVYPDTVPELRRGGSQARRGSRSAR